MAIGMQLVRQPEPLLRKTQQCTIVPRPSAILGRVPDPRAACCRINSRSARLAGLSCDGSPTSDIYLVTVMKIRYRTGEARYLSKIRKATNSLSFAASYMQPSFTHGWNNSQG